MVQGVSARPKPNFGHSWASQVDLDSIVREVGTPVFIYSEDQLTKNVTRVHRAAQAAGLGGRTRLYVPFFPNSNPHVVDCFRGLGVGVLVQLPNEYNLLHQLGFSDFIVSPGHVSDDEISFWSKTGCRTFLASLDEVGAALKMHAPSISARIDGLDSGKPGIKLSQLDRLQELLEGHGRDLESFEVYCGSGNSLEDMAKVIETMFSIFNRYFPTARSVNFAGGHGFSYEGWEDDEKHFDWGTYFGVIAELAARENIPEHVEFLFEPARDVLADVGVLVLSVKRDLITGPASNIVVTDGSRMLMPSAQLRDRRHNVAFFDANMCCIDDAGGAGALAAVRGRSILRHDYVLPGEYWVPEEVNADSYIAILDVGAYCATQHMEFLNIPPAPEVLVESSGTAHLVTARGDDLDKWRNVLPDPVPVGTRVVR